MSTYFYEKPVDESAAFVGECTGERLHVKTGRNVPDIADLFCIFETLCKNINKHSYFEV